MPTTLRIHIPHTSPLDGTTPLPRGCSVRNDAIHGIQVVDLGPNDRFGALDPAQIVTGRTGAYWVKHLTVVSKAGPHAPGCFVGLLGPEVQGMTPLDPPPLPFVQFAAASELATGVLTEGLCMPIPPGHRIVFDTRADGDCPGPHVIQITLAPIPALAQACIGRFIERIREEDPPEFGRGPEPLRLPPSPSETT